MWKKLKENESGFTLVEFVTVMVIIAVFVAISTPVMAGSIEKAKKEKYVEETRRVAEAVQFLMVQEYAAGTYDFFDFVVEIQQELKPQGNKIAELLDGDFTPGAKIEELNTNDRTIRLTALTYLVDSYRIELNFKKNTVTFK